MLVDVVAVITLMSKNYHRTLSLSLSLSLHTYIHYWTLQFFSQDYELASHFTDVMCINFIHE